MKILLCIKQVPDTKEVTIDTRTGTLNRVGVESILNPFCEFALEKSLTIKEQCGGEIVTITMGPPSGERGSTKDTRTRSRPSIAHIR